MKSLRRAVKRVVYRALSLWFGRKGEGTVLPVLTGPAKGLRFSLDLIVREEGAYFTGSYDSKIISKIGALCEPGWTIWDCGTYLGFYTNFFARHVGALGTVVAIEPDPCNLERTKKNIALNGYSNVQFVHAAVGEPLGEIDFISSDNTNSHIPGSWVWGVQPEENADSRTIRVPCMSLDQLLENDLPVPNLVKLDIEGAEMTALNHCKRFATEAKPYIVLELHNPECDAAAWDFSQRSGYSLFQLPDLTPIEAASEVNGTLLCVPPGTRLPAETNKRKS